MMLISNIIAATIAPIPDQKQILSAELKASLAAPFFIVKSLQMHQSMKKFLSFNSSLKFSQNLSSFSAFPKAAKQARIEIKMSLLSNDKLLEIYFSLVVSTYFMFVFCCAASE